ncbi:DC-STAMP domain-containing protein 2-like [Neodiprion virginianus]|uniref:DC-STAMP domain-containing protein 2-like n=1 Tax=Neodiprion fabricii TaxID=2872261 RepID=UPI001ED8D3FD|nr:DC-STAMP domain-containing protein 2-like [Neodiprion fabricii]XP_046607581.1 DC-STAMP domain-containing protein 2-like [Neodiprion virginianus]
MKLLYQDEKMRSIEVSKGAKIHYTFRQKIRYKKKLLILRFKNWLKSLASCPKDSWFHEKAVLLRTDGTFENYVLKSVLGFLGGIFLTYMFFMFFIFQLNFTLSSATLFSSFLGIILTIGLAFSNRVRCVVFLLLPQFFSKRGRQALMAYAFILALTGPAKNTLNNMGVLSESLACGQEQLKAAVRAIVDLIKEPFYALRDAIAKVMKSLKKVIKKIKRTLLAVKRIVLSILKVIKAVFQWLGSIMNICNKKLGTPFERCEKVFDGAVADCKASLGPFFGAICNLAYIAGLLCWIVKPFDIICMLVSFISDSIIDVVRKKINKFTKHVKAMFYVKVKFSHSFHFETNQSKSISEVATGIVTEIRSRTDRFLTVFDWMTVVTSLFFLFMMLRVIYYRNKWLTNERFDNRYLTDDLREIDLRRARLDKETVLPLNRREKNKYIPLTSIILIKSEKIKLTKSAVFLCLMTFKLGIHMVADYSLYWVLSTIRYHGRFESKVETPNSVGVYVSGTGFLADLYRSIVRAFSPKGTEVNMDTMPCLPDPIPPDLDRYTQIVSLIFLCWIMAVFEPYGLRLRHVVMCYYHPDRARQRAVWLYNHIIRSRGSFMKYARRQLRRKFTKSDKMKTERVTLRERLVAICPILRHCCGAEKAACLLCGAVEREDQSLIKCPKPTCIGLFCVQCFADLQNRCTICMEPIDYGDLSDISEERYKINLSVPRDADTENNLLVAHVDTEILQMARNRYLVDKS